MLYSVSIMKGCARSLLVQLAGFLAVVGGVMAFLQFKHGMPPGKTLGASLAAGFFGWVGLGLLVGILQAARERSALRDCLAGRRPADGKRAGIAGTITASGELLRAPFSGSECLAYKYEIFQIVGSGRRSHRYSYFEGIALVPSVITTPAGIFRLLAVPAFDFRTDSISPERALGQWTEHVTSARFEPKDSRRTLEKQ